MSQNTLFSLQKNSETVLTISIMGKRAQDAFLTVRHAMFIYAFRKSETALSCITPTTYFL